MWVAAAVSPSGVVVAGERGRLSVRGDASTVSKKRLEVPATRLGSRGQDGTVGDDQVDALARADRVVSLRLCPRRITLHTGEHYVLAPLPLSATGEAVQGALIDWTSDHPDIADASGYNEIVAGKPGRAVVTASSGSASVSVEVQVRSGMRTPLTDADWAREHANDCTEEQSRAMPERPAAQFSTRLRQASSFVARSSVSSAFVQGGCDQSAVFGSGIMAYTNERGAVRNHLFERTSPGTTSTPSMISYGSSNFSFAAPVLDLPGRGIDVDLSLTYNSRVWTKSGTKMIFDYDQDWPTVGWALGYGYIIPNYNNTRTGNGSGSGSGNSPGDYLLVLGDGGRMHLGTYYTGGVWKHKTTDGTFLSYDLTTGLLAYPDGHRVLYNTINNRLLPTAVYTTNGDKITITYKTGFGWTRQIDYITDTLGRVVQFVYDGSKQLTSITTPAFGSGTRTLVQIDYQLYTFSYSFDPTLTVSCPGGMTRSVIRRIYYPATGRGYLFDDYSAFGMIRRVSVRAGMGSQSYQTGSEIAYTTYDYPVGTGTNYTDMPTFSTRGEYWQGKTDDSGNPTSSPSNYTYQRTIDTGAGTDTTTVTHPNGLRVVTTTTLASGNLATTEFKNASGTVLAKEVTTYVTPSDGGTQVGAVERYNDLNQSTKVSFDYGSYGRVTNQYEYDFKVGGTYPLLRRTAYSYVDTSSYLNKSFLRLVSQVGVYDGGGIQKVKTAVIYDDYAAKGGMLGYSPMPPNHESLYGTGFTIRGNVTGIQRWSDVAGNVSTTVLRKIDICGNVVQADVDCCSVKNFVFGSGMWHSVSTSATDGTSGVVPFLTTSYTYDFNTSLKTIETDPENLQVQYAYDADWRLTSVTAPSGATRTVTEDDAALTRTTQSTYSDAGSSKTVTTKEWLDGGGRMLRSGIGAGTSPSSFDTVAAKYDSMGRAIKRSNPYLGDASGNGTASHWTTTAYDLLGRVSQTTLQDGQTLTSSYSGSTVIRTDTVNRQRQYTADGLGRVIEIKEQDPATGSLSWSTTYQYDVLDNKTSINQGGQTRTMVFDGRSRMTTQTTPEAGTDAFTYTDFGAVRKKTDARGVEKHHGYDTLNRLTSVWYTGTGGDDSGTIRPALPSGVAATGDITYSYNNFASPGPGNGKLNSVADGTGTESYQFDSLGRLNTKGYVIDGLTFTTTYGYNGIGQIAAITYPSGRQITYGFDGKGRPLSVSEGATSYVSAINYDVAGHETSVTLGNTLVESSTYSDDRQELTGQTVIKPGSPDTTLLSLTYGYTPGVSGAFGAGTTNANSGQVVSITGSINGVSQNQVFTYDNVLRLVTATQSGSWARRYAYDRWGNRTGVWDATTGGTQIQSFVLQQSGGYPTNRITSVTNTGVTTPYTYNNSGDVTNDGSTFTYDADHRLASTTGTSTGTYFYSAQRLRVKKVVAGITSYAVWEGNHVLSEHSGTGAVLADHLYRSEKMIGTIDATGLLYSHSDRLSIRMLTTTTGSVAGTQSHMPFGEDSGASGSVLEQRFTSYERDQGIGSDHAVNRQYMYAIGRFNRPDPVLGSCRRPQGLNRYAYVGNDPVNLIDPLGLEGEATSPGQACPGGGVLVWVQVGSESGYGYYDCVLRNGDGQAPSPQEGREPTFGGKDAYGECMRACLEAGHPAIEESFAPRAVAIEEAFIVGKADCLQKFPKPSGGERKPKDQKKYEKCMAPHVKSRDDAYDALEKDVNEALRKWDTDKVNIDNCHKNKPFRCRRYLSEA